MQTHLIIHSNQAKFSDLNLCPASSVLFVVYQPTHPQDFPPLFFSLTPNHTLHHTPQRVIMRSVALAFACLATGIHALPRPAVSYAVVNVDGGSAPTSTAAAQTTVVSTVVESEAPTTVSQTVYKTVTESSLAPTTVSVKTVTEVSTAVPTTSSLRSTASSTPVQPSKSASSLSSSPPSSTSQSSSPSSSPSSPSSQASPSATAISSATPSSSTSSEIQSSTKSTLPSGQDSATHTVKSSTATSHVLSTGSMTATPQVSINSVVYEVTGGALSTDYVTVTLSGGAQTTSSASSTSMAWSSSEAPVSTLVVVQTQTVVPAAATSTKSESYYDNGMWHTSYVIKNYPTLAPSAAGHHWNGTSH